MFEDVGMKSYDLDTKWRVRCPFGDSGSTKTVYVMIVPERNPVDRCLICMTEEQFAAYYEELSCIETSNPAYRMVRLIFSSVAQIKPDASGRILIPADLREYANLTKTVYFCTNTKGVEIWDAERFKRKRESDMTDILAYESFNEIVNGVRPITDSMLESAERAVRFMELQKQYAEAERSIRKPQTTEGTGTA